MRTSASDASGRVLAVDETSLQLLCDGRVQHVAVRVPPHVKPGDFVSVHQDGRVQIVQPYLPASFPTPNRDLDRFLKDSKWTKLRQRAHLLQKVREFFIARDFLEVETPLLVPSPGTEVHIDAVRANVRPGPGQESLERFLITSPEYHMKRLLSAGAGPIFQIARVFRDGELGAHHRPEFSMLEWYRPFVTYETLMTDCEELVLHLANTEYIEFGGRTISLARPWPRLTFREAISHFTSLDPASLSLDQQLECMVTQVEPALDPTRPHFITEFPIGLASLARPKPTDDTVAERFELFIGGLELANAFGELTDEVVQRQRCEAEIEERHKQGKSKQPRDEDFLGALNEGCPPASGIALGIDRLMMLLANADSIDEVLAF